MSKFTISSVLIKCASCGDTFSVDSNESVSLKTISTGFSMLEKNMKLHSKQCRELKK